MQIYLRWQLLKSDLQIDECLYTKDCERFKKVNQNNKWVENVINRSAEIIH